MSDNATRIAPEVRVSLAPALSALIVAHNEEAQLAGCLSGLGFADEIVILLDRCTDRSREVASQFTDRIVEGGVAARRAAPSGRDRGLPWRLGFRD